MFQWSHLKFSQILNYLYGALFVLTPLVMYAKTSELFEFNKLLIIYLITGLVVSVWIARSISARKWILRPSVFLYGLGIFLVTQILSTIFSIDPHTSFFGYYGRFNGGLLSIICYSLLAVGFYANTEAGNVRESIEKLLKLSIAASIVVILWGLPSKFGYDLSCLVFTGKLDVSCWTEQFKPTIRMFSTLGQPNWLGAYLVSNICFAVYFYFTDMRRRSAFLWSTYMVLGMTTLLFTRSRSSLFACGLSLALFGIYMIFKKKEYFAKKSYSMLALLAACVILPIVIFGTGIEKVDHIVQPSQWFHKQTPAPVTKAHKSLPMTDIVTDSSAIRKIVWQGAFNVGMEHPLFGTGVETFAYSYNFLRSREHNMTSEWDYVYNKAHNQFFNYFATTGFPGVFAYMGLVALTILMLKDALARKLSKNDELLVVALLIAHVALSVCNFFGFSTTTQDLYFYLIPVWMGLIIYKPTLKKWDDDVVSAKLENKWIALPFLIALGSCIFVMSYLRADVLYAQADVLNATQRYDEAVAVLFQAYSTRPEHIYADKISQSLSQLAYIQAAQGMPLDQIRCRDYTGKEDTCIDLSNKYSDIAIKGSPQNSLYYRTRARNNFYHYQITQDEKYYTMSTEALKKAQTLAPTDPRFYYFKSLFALGKFELIKKPTDKDKKTLEMIGLPAAQFAIQLKTNYVDAYVAKGLVLKALGKDAEAKKVFLFVRDNLDPNNGEVMRELKEAKPVKKV